MRETSLETSQSLTSEQKCAALEAVLHSQTFARSDQLKSFLKYVCEMEMAGRGHELSEYLIGIEALGRPASYSPGDDSAVRTRAFALRKKLQEFYEHEQPDAALRIELLKGSYCPHFVESQPHQKANGNGMSAEQLAPQFIPSPTAHEELVPAEVTGRRELQRSWLLPFSAGVILTALLAGMLYWWLGAKPASNAVSHNPTPILVEAWGPLLAPGADVLLCVANPTSFSVHPSALSPATTTTPFNYPGALPMPQQLYELYNTRSPTPANPTLTITRNGTYWGDVLGALTAFRILNAAGVSPQIFPEITITMPMLRRRNVILFGAPDYSSTVARFQENCPLRVNYLDAIVGPAAGQAPAARYALKLGQQQRLTQVFGLITVLPGESSANQQTRILIFSGVNSAGAQAAAEFFSSPAHLLELKKELKKAGHDTFPPAYQVVVRAETDDSIMLNFRYETYRVIPPSASH
ncbi:MAG TPA: hypothetical protein VFD58_04845 [Blastocatellia bacterium]|nr:hypothetical protein [Blastocatellia bacterium]